jgi:glycosyltransferase involved in cell wall biosynthesis
MKILHIIPFFAPKFGGTVASVFLLSKELAKRGHNVTIITSDLDYDRNYAKSLEEFGVKVIPFHNVANFGLFIYTPSMKKWLKKNIQQYKIIHLHNFRAYQYISIPNFAFQNNIPYIVQAHGTVLPLFEKLFLKKCFDVMWGNKILKNAALCVALTKTESDQYEKMGVPEKKIVIIPNGIDISQYEDLPSRCQFRSKYQIPENVQIILSLGRIHKIKGIDLLVSAFSRLCSKMSDVKLVIAGPDGGYLPRIQQQIRELQLEKYVLFTGPLYGKDKLEAYIDADVYVLPSRYEAFSYTLLEAWICGTPVIATKNCCLSDTIRYTGNSAIVEFDPVQMQEKILDLLTDEEKRKKIGMKGKKLVQDNFEITKIVQKIEEIYEAI